MKLAFKVSNLLVAVLVLGVCCSCMANEPPAQDPAFQQALGNARRANEGFERCQRYVKAWLEHADPNTGLIPRKVGMDKDQAYWDAANCAADNYPFMVLSAAVTDRPLLEGRMLDMLRTETKLTSRVGTLPDTYLFAKAAFRDAEPDMGRILFGASEYIKDGLLPITEWLGASPWSERMLGMLDDMWKHAPIETRYGKIVSESHEINGEMLQTLSRVYWMTGERKYLEWAERLGDYYLLNKHHPTRDAPTLRLRDHGCEIVSGLCELYATVQFAKPEKKQSYHDPVHEMLDTILKLGRNEHGLFYNQINPATGPEKDRKGIADTWGYTLNGYYTAYLVDGTQSYRKAVLKALSSLNEHYRNYPWEGKSADGYADSIESALNLYNREPVPSAAEWIDSEINVMWRKQKPDGIIEGWHGDGNFARTTVMYCLWKTQGLTIRPWRKDVCFGAVREGDALKIVIAAEKPWNGKILFDVPRHRINMKMPLDWPRINQFPEWFTVDSEKKYVVSNLTTASQSAHTGAELRQGLDIELTGRTEQRLVAEPADSANKPMRIVRTDEGFSISQGQNKVLFYQTKPKSLDGKHTRCNYVHPLYGLDGEILTEDFPEDHPHHRGIFWAWHQLLVDDKKIADGWSLKDFSMDVCDAQILPSGPDFAALKVHLNWSSPLFTDDKAQPKPFIRETTVIRAHRAEADLRKIDFEINLLALADNVRIGGAENEKAYGGFSTRIRLPEGTTFIGAIGPVEPLRTPIEGGPWMALSADFLPDKISGLAILCHKSLPKYPQLWILRRKRSMQNPVYPGREPVLLSREKPLTLRYRLVIHRGPTNPETLNKLQAEYNAQP